MTPNDEVCCKKQCRNKFAKHFPANFFARYNKVVFSLNEKIIYYTFGPTFYREKHFDRRRKRFVF